MLTIMRRFNTAQHVKTTINQQENEIFYNKTLLFTIFITTSYKHLLTIYTRLISFLSVFTLCTKLQQQSYRYRYQSWRRNAQPI